MGRNKNLPGRADLELLLCWCGNIARASSRAGDRHGQDLRPVLVLGESVASSSTCTRRVDVYTVEDPSWAQPRTYELAGMMQRYHTTPRPRPSPGREHGRAPCPARKRRGPTAMLSNIDASDERPSAWGVLCLRLAASRGQPSHLSIYQSIYDHRLSCFPWVGMTMVCCIEPGQIGIQPVGDVTCHFPLRLLLDRPEEQHGMSVWHAGHDRR